MMNNQLCRYIQHGLSLVEMLIVLMLGTLVLIAITQIYSSQAESYRWQQTQARLQEDLRLAHTLVQADLLAAQQVEWRNGELTLYLGSSPKQFLSSLVGQALGEWSVQGGVMQIRNPAPVFTALRQGDCLIVNAQLMVRRSSPGQGAGQGNITLENAESHECVSGSVFGQFRVEQENVYGLGQTSIKRMGVNAQQEFFITENSNVEVPWLQGVIAFEVEALMRDQTAYRAAATIEPEEWREVKSVRLAILLESPEHFSRVPASQHNLLSDATYNCAQGRYCRSAVSTLRLRNHEI